MQSNNAGELLVPTPPTLFPFVRRFGDVAIVALSSAVPTMPFVAAGKIGTLQRGLLAEALARLGREGLFRVVLIHHPPLPGQASWRRGLRDAGRTTRVIKQNGAELVLHGHDHRQTVHEIDTVSGPAASSACRRPQRRSKGSCRRPATTSIASRGRAMAGMSR